MTSVWEMAWNRLPQDLRVSLEQEDFTHDEVDSRIYLHLWERHLQGCHTAIRDVQTKVHTARFLQAGGDPEDPKELPWRNKKRSTHKWRDYL